jgi:hypothetical protein
MLKTSQEEAFDAARVTLYSFLFLTCEDRYSGDFVTVRISLHMNVFYYIATDYPAQYLNHN